MKNYMKMLMACLFAVMVMGMSPVVAMDHISGVKRQAEDDGREDAKKQRVDDDKQALYDAVVKNEYVAAENLLLMGCDPNFSVNDKTPLWVAVVDNKNFDMETLLFGYGAFLDLSTWDMWEECNYGYDWGDVGEFIGLLFYARSYQIGCYDDLYYDVETHKANEDFALECLEEDYAGNRYATIKFLLLQSPQFAQKIMMHAPYQFINPAIQKRISVKDKDQKSIIKVVSDKEWLEHELKQNSKNIECQDECTKLYCAYTFGEQLKKRAQDATYSDLVVKTAW